MRVPIAYGLSFPERIESGASRLVFPDLTALSFEAVDERRFPGLQLAWDCLRGPAGSTAVLNAANEVAVAAFLEGSLPFTGVYEVNRHVVDSLAPRLGCVGSLDEVLDADQRARQLAAQRAREIAAC